MKYELPSELAAEMREVLLRVAGVVAKDTGQKAVSINVQVFFDASVGAVQVQSSVAFGGGQIARPSERFEEQQEKGIPGKAADIVDDLLKHLPKRGGPPAGPGSSK